MRLLPWFLVSTAAALAVGLWWSASRGPLPEVPAPITAQGSQDVVPEPANGERRPPSEAPQVIETLETPQAPTLADLEANYRFVQGKSQEDERRAMGAIVEVGTELAYDFVVHQLEHPGTLLSNGDDRQRCAAAWSVLGSIRNSPAVFRFAVSAIDAARSRGTFTAALGDYHRLAAQNGGEAAALFLLEQLDATAEFAHAAARAIGALTDRGLLEKFLARALDPTDRPGLDDRSLRSEIIRGLVAWGDQDVTGRIDGMVFEDLREIEQRLTLLAGLGVSWDRNMVERTRELLADLEARPDDPAAKRLRETLVTSWTRLKSPTFDDAACRDLLGPIVQRGLAVGERSALSEERFRGALRLLEAHPVLCDDGVKATLQEWIAGDPAKLPSEVVASRARLVGLVGRQ